MFLNRIFPSVIKCITILAVYAHSVYALPVRLEAKRYDDRAFLVFYHSDDLKVKTNARGGIVRLSFDQPIELSLMNEVLINRLTSDLNVQDDHLSLEVKLESRYIAQKTINGEKLTAITLNDIEHQIAQLEKDSVKQLESKVEQIDDVEVKLTQNTNGSRLYFPWKQRGVGAAVFSEGDDLYIVFSKLQQFAVPESDATILQTLRRINHPDATIFTFKKDPNAFYSLAKQKNGWVLISSATEPKQRSKSKISFVDDSTENISEILIKGDFSQNKLISFVEDRGGKNFVALPLVGLNQYVSNSGVYSDIKTLPTLQGAAFVVNNKDIQTDLGQNGLSLKQVRSTPAIVPDTKEKKAPKKTTTILDIPMSYDAILPMQEAQHDNDTAFLEERRQVMIEISETQSPEELYKARLKLAELYFTNTLYHEASGVIELLYRDSAELFAASPYANFLYAVSLSLIGEHKFATDYYRSARTMYIRITDAVPAEVAMWRDYNDYKTGLYSNTVEIDRHLEGIISNYSDELYWNLVFADLDIYLQLGKLDKAEALLKNTRSPKLQKYADLLRYYTAIFYKKTEKHLIAREYLRDLVKSTKNPRVKVMAELELVRLLQNNKAISTNEAINRLDALRFTWRGDKLEYELLLQLANYYKAKGNILESLRTMKYLTDAFAGKVSTFFLTSEMVTLYNRLFVTDKEIEKLSDFEVISVFYEFKYLNPIGVEGDDVILMVANRMLNLDLLNNAIALLQHQVKYRLKGEKRVITAEHLATIYLMNKQPQEAINVLQNTDRDNINLVSHAYRSRLKANAYVDLGRYLDALFLLQGDKSEAADILREEIYFKSEMWVQYIDVVEQGILTNLAGGAEVSDSDIIKLAIAYSNAGKYTALKNLQKLTVNPSSTVKTILELLLLTNTPVSMQDISTTLPFDQMQGLLQQYRSDLF